MPFLICKIPVGLGGTPDCSASALNASLRLHCLLVQTEEQLGACGLLLN